MSEYEKVFIFFKKVIGAPVVERRLDYCGDVSFCCDSGTYQHVEIGFRDKIHPYETYIATTNRGIMRVNRDYTFIDSEGFWVCYSIKIPKSEIDLIRQYCESCIDNSVYDFSSLYLVCLEQIAFMMKKKNTHSCASLTFTALLESPSFKNLLLRCIFNGDFIEMMKKAHSSDPNNIYRVLKMIKRKSEEDDTFDGLYPVEKEKIAYTYDFASLGNSNKICIISSDEYFTTLHKSQEDDE